MSEEYIPDEDLVEVVLPTIPEEFELPPEEIEREDIQTEPQKGKIAEGGGAAFTAYQSEALPSGIAIGNLLSPTELEFAASHPIPYPPVAEPDASEEFSWGKDIDISFGTYVLTEEEYRFLFKIIFLYLQSSSFITAGCFLDEWGEERYWREAEGEYSPEVNDSLQGGDKADLIAGLLGNDDIKGGAGEDTLFGNQGDDDLWGQDDPDILIGGMGEDFLFGGSGNDILYGDGCMETPIWMESSDDDLLDGGIGDDILYGGWGNDFMYGEEGADTLYGGSGDDIMKGGRGDDLLMSNEGADTLQGGGGTDTYVFRMVSDELKVVEDLQEDEVIDLDALFDELGILNNEAREDAVSLLWDPEGGNTYLLVQYQENVCLSVMLQGFDGSGLDGDLPSWIRVSDTEYT